LLDRQDELRVGDCLLHRLSFGLNALVMRGGLLELSGSLSQGTEDANEVTVGHVLIYHKNIPPKECKRSVCLLTQRLMALALPVFAC